MNSNVYVTHEKRDRFPHNWSKRDKLASNFILHMRIALAQQNLNIVEKLLMNVSHPESPNYGRHMTPSQIVDMFAPSQKTVSAVTEWLQDSGITTTRIITSASKGWISFNLTVAEAERLLKTNYHVYEHESGMLHYATEEYSVPAYIKDHIDFITPTLHFDVKVSSNPEESNSLKKRTRRDVVKSVRTGLATRIRPGGLAPYANSGTPHNLSYCDQEITPDCLKALYKIDYEPVAIDKNSYGVVEYTPQCYIQPDLKLFLSQYKPSAKDAKPDIHFIDGAICNITGTGDFNTNGESNLDLQYAISLVYPSPVTLYQTGDPVEGASFNNFLDAIDKSYCGGDDPSYDGTYPDPYKSNTGAYEGPENCGKYKPTDVISTSYGYNEDDLTPAYELRQCHEYAKLGLMGVTILYSSGDYGVAGNGGYCMNAHGSNTIDGTTFNPSFPSTCPFVTSVGATQINPGSTVFDPESACEQVIFSGGGFSNVFALPDYQKAAVKSFFKSHKPPYSAVQYNSTGTSRGFPDISANGANYVVAIGGQFYLVYGTSASSPVVGSMVTLINNARRRKGKKPVGFMNPTLYSSDFRSAWNDITSGNNPGCGTPGFTAVKGWDPVTGLGTINFPKLLALYLSLP